MFAQAHFEILNKLRIRFARMILREERFDDGKKSRLVIFERRIDRKEFFVDDLGGAGHERRKRRRKESGGRTVRSSFIVREKSIFAEASDFPVICAISL